MLVRRRPPDSDHSIPSWSSALLLHTLVIFFILLTCSLAQEKKTQCLQKPEVSPKRYLTVEGKPTVMELGVSNSITHQLVTHVLQIYLEEILGYPSISIVKTDVRDLSSVLEKFRGVPRNNITEGIVRWPANYVNLQVWIPPDSNQVVIMEAGEATDVGNIGPPSSYGIYAINRIHPNTARDIGPENEIFWKVLANASTAVDYRPIQVDVNFLMQSTMLVGGSYYCDENSTIHNEPLHCEYGVYSPPWCKENNSTCALLVTDYVELSGFLWKEIEGRKLYVQIAWLGGNLESFLDRLHENSTVLLAEATSEPLILLPKPQFKMKKIQLPLCNDFQDQFGCHLYTNRLGKLIPTKFRDWAGPAYETLLKIEFDSKDYKELVSYWMKEREYKGGKEETLLKNAACSWLKKHENASSNSSNFWSVWSTGEEDRRTLQIIGIFPLSKESERYPMAQGIVNGALMAQTAINENKQILRDYNLEIKLQNGQCQADLVLKTFVDIIKNEDFKRVAGILGPACSDTVEPLVAVAKHYKTVVISYSAEGSTFSDRNKYPFFFRTIGENRKYKFVYEKLFNHFKWKRVTSLTEDGTKYTEYIAHLETLLHQRGLKLSNKKFPTDWTLETMKQYLENLKNENIRIIIADMNDEAARAVMCEAYRKQMTAAEGYVWFLPLWLSDNWYNTTNVTNSTHWSGTKFPCSTFEMEKAINGHFAISHAFFGSDNATMQENITVSEWRESYKQRLARFNSPESNYAGYAYDAVWVYAFALDKLIKKNHSYLANLHEETATGFFVDFIQKTDFYGVSGRINFKGGSSRDSPINVLQWYNRSTKIVGTFTPFDDETSTKDDYGELVMKDDELVWLNEKESVPWDGTPEKQKCLLSSFANFLNADCETAVVIFSVFGFCILLAIVIIAFIVIKNRYDKKAELTQKIIDALGIDLLNESTMSFLDQWEIQRENVVINRRLGEGAFGTVYGGEAFFKEKGWVPVAVKTLKVGSTTEEKLDFLSEAEVMKRFEHKNIVKLLGVCTKNEPIYNVMEFMLYGDLKTFLLARRHMVNNDKLNDDNEEVSSKKLTQMSLDVARALSYLAECKYVHRDVASRNCLINSSRVVKLGDFGMTRPIHENGCYEFNRRGMLPVRWMAPESLGMGIFTHKSDVWSYGVLLFEIITFGSFPFQGMSNNEVLDYVKQGNTISIPDGIKPQLDTLLKQCWKREPKERPNASEIVELIANNQKLLTPCLDVPLKSVIMEDTEQLEISMERGMRRRSGAGFAAALRRASASSLTAATLVGNMVGATSPDEIHADGSVIPLLSTSPNSIPRYLPLRDMDCPLEYCNHIENHVDSIL